MQGVSRTWLIAGLWAIVCVVCTPVCWAADQTSARPELSKPELSKPESRSTRQIEGWTVHVDDRLLAEDGPEAEVGHLALKRMEHSLFAVRMTLPADKVAWLQTVPIYLDFSHGGLTSAQYHPSPQWLKNNGYSPELARAVHFPHARRFANSRHMQTQPWVVLHELAHAYHHQALGYDNRELQSLWQAVVESQRLEEVLHIHGHKTRHYALTNEKEFFAEMTEAFFGTNDFYPFTHGELRQDFPEVYQLIRKLWTEPLESVAPKLKQVN